MEAIRARAFFSNINGSDTSSPFLKNKYGSDTCFILKNVVLYLKSRAYLEKYGRYNFSTLILLSNLIRECVNVRPSRARQLNKAKYESYFFYFINNRDYSGSYSQKKRAKLFFMVDLRFYGIYRRFDSFVVNKAALSIVRYRDADA